MDGDSFDRLSVVVNRLREKASRRDALRLLLGGSAVAAGGLLVESADARKKNKNKNKKCRGFGGRCGSNRDCCNGQCRNGFCFPSSGNGGGNGGRCNGRFCPSGQRCCRLNGFDVCVYDNHPFCFNNTCPSGWERCGGAFQCCGPDQQCCSNGRCCPDLSGWSCGDIACEFDSNNRSAGEAIETTPFEDPTDFSEADSADLES